MHALIASPKVMGPTAEHCETCVPCLTDTTTNFREGGFNRDGSNVQKQLAEESNTMLSRLHMADISTAVSRGIQTTGRDALVDAFINRRESERNWLMKQSATTCANNSAQLVCHR